MFSATGLLIGLQVLGTGLGFASWWQVRAACQRQLALGAQRDAVLELAAEARESYVHEAHTFIEGGAGHLDHLAATAKVVDLRLSEVSQMALPPEADIGAVRTAIIAANTWFEGNVAPLARAGTLDRPTAVALHAEAERRAEQTEQAISAVLDAISAEQQAEVADIGTLTSRAWIAVGLLTLGGAGLGAVIARRLARAVLGPVGALQVAARAIASGQPASAPEGGDVELAELGASFNAMVRQVGAAEQRRVQVERLAALGEMSGAVAHELINPLSVILGHEGLRTPELAPVRAEAEHALRVVQGLLGFARPGEEPAELVDVAAAARAAVDRIVPSADVRDVEVRLVQAVPAPLLASPSAVRQVLDNLLRNAVEASAPGGVVEVEVCGGPHVEVRDRGPGIPSAIRPRLYEPFVTGRHAGTGLGLAICQRIVRAQGGSLSHRDRAGGGTVAVWEARHA